jgi:ABC-type transport system substrate-binding protein
LNSPASLAYVSSLVSRKYDVAKAQTLLKEAGYPNGFKTRIIVGPGTNMNIPQAIQSFLAKVGIQASIDLMEAAKYNEVTSGTWNNGLVLNPLIEWANPNTGFNFFWGTPSSWFKSTGRPEGWADAVTASNITEVADANMTQKLETMAYDHVLVIPLYFGTSLWATTKNINDSGIGTRGAGTWFEPQDIWFNK